jgi:hypothetical protein
MTEKTLSESKIKDLLSKYDFCKEGFVPTVTKLAIEFSYEEDSDALLQ